MKRILALTQCFPCGSWVCIEKILDKLFEGGYEVIVVGLGAVPQKNKKFIYHPIPFLAYTRFGNITINPLISMLWNLPLFIVGLFYFLVKRPKIVTYNGLASGLVLSPLVKMFGSKNVIMYHSYLGQVRDSLFTKLAKFCGKFVDIVVANSRGSAKDVLQIFDENKIVINEHFAEDVFFDNSSNPRVKLDTFVISYAGRIDEDKLCFSLMEAAKRLYEIGDFSFSFNFVGVGSDVDKIIDYSAKYSNIHYLGYVNDRKLLKRYYENSDVLWSFADETYLGMPAVEALACGTPIIVPIYAAIKGSRKLIEKTLVPSSVGWFINTDNIDEIIKLLIQIKQNGISSVMNENCITYAKEKYSSSNVDNTVFKLIALLDKNVD